MTEANVVAICSSGKRGVPKEIVSQGFFKEKYGLVGDAHAGQGDKEISILLSQYLDPVARQLGERPGPGSFAENLVVSGLDEKDIKTGTLVKAGGALLEVQRVGKDPSERHTYSFRGFSLLAEKGIFCRVVKTGPVKTGDPVVLSNNFKNPGMPEDFNTVPNWRIE